MEGIRTFKLDSTLKHSVELNRHEQKRAPASNLAPNLMILVGFRVFHARLALHGSLILPGDETMSAQPRKVDLVVYSVVFFFGVWENYRVRRLSNFMTMMCYHLVILNELLL